MAFFFTAQLFQAFETVVVGVIPAPVFGGFIPAGVVQGIQVQYVGLTIARDQIKCSRHAHSAFVKINGEYLLLYIVIATYRFFLYRK